MFSRKGWGFWVGGRGRECNELLGSAAAKDKTVREAVLLHKSIRLEAVIWHRSIRLLDDIAALGWQIP